MGAPSGTPLKSVRRTSHCSSAGRARAYESRASLPSTAPVHTHNAAHRACSYSQPSYSHERHRICVAGCHAGAGDVGGGAGRGWCDRLQRRRRGRRLTPRGHATPFQA